MKSIPRSDFTDLLMEVKTARPVTFIATTDTGANKNSVAPDPISGEKIPNPYEKILKRSRVNGFIAYDYEAAVNRQRVREGETADFAAGERKHGERIAPAVSETNGVRKMVVKVQNYLGSEYFGVPFGSKPGDPLVPLTEAEAKKFIREKSKPKNQGVEKAVDHKEYNISNLEEVTLDGEIYKLV